MIANGLWTMFVIFSLITLGIALLVAVMLFPALTKVWGEWALVYLLVVSMLLASVITTIRQWFRT